jgi:exopolysaccharide production protein ExoZ
MLIEVEIVEAIAKMKTKQLRSIQYLRAIAALSIVFFHAKEQFPGFQAVFPSNVSSGGVDIFFVISGFIMVFITDKGDRDVPKFIWNRIIRVAPLYWFYTLLTVFGYTIAAGLFRGGGLTFEHVILSMLFIPHYNPGSMAIGPFVKSGWTLDYEMFFYFVFAMSMLINDRHRILLTCSFLSLLVIIGVYQFPWLPAELQFYGNDILLEFVAGMLLCRFYQTGNLQPVRFIKICLLAIGILLIIVQPSAEVLAWRSIKFGIPAVWLVAGMLSFERFIPELRLPLLLGNASYSIYLSHFVGIAILRYLYPRLGIPTAGLFSTLAFVSISLIVGSLCGIISHVWIEKPLLKLCRNLQKPSQT